MSPLVSAELLKLQRQPGLLFWGFLSVPAVALSFKIALESVFFVRFGSFPQEHTDILMSAAHSLGIAGNPIAQLLYAIGVASLFFMEYRFSTWRNLVPRAGRLPVFAAKFAVCLLLMVVGLVLTAAGDMGLNTVLALLGGGASEEVPVQANGLLVLSAAFVIAFLELATLAAMVTAITIIFRSMMAAIVPVFLFGIFSSLLQGYFGATVVNLPVPSIAADAARAWLFADAHVYFGMAGFAALLAWLLAMSTIGAIALWRQSLATE